MIILGRHRVSGSGLWGEVNRVFGALDGATDGELHRRATRLTAGADFRVGDDSFISLMLSRSTYRARSTPKGSAITGDTTLAGASLQSGFGSWSGQVGFIAGDLQGASMRLGGISGLSPVEGENDGHAWAIDSQLSREFDLSGWDIEAAYGLTHVDISRRTLSEKGVPDATLLFEPINLQSTRAHASLETRVNFKDVSSRVRLGISHEPNQTHHTAVAALTLLPDAPFGISLTPEERTWVELNLSVPYRPMAGIEFTVQGGTVLNDKTGGQSIGLTGRFRW